MMGSQHLATVVTFLVTLRLVAAFKENLRAMSKSCNGDSEQDNEEGGKMVCEACNKKSSESRWLYYGALHLDMSYFPSQ